jgi:stage II sporulation protein D
MREVAIKRFRQSGRKIKNIAAFSLAVLLFVFTGHAFAGSDGGLDGLFDVEIRVALERSATKAEIDGDGGTFTITSGENGARFNAGEPTKILAEGTADGIKINHKVYPVRVARVESSSGTFSFNGKKFRGYLLLWDGPNGAVDVINHLPLESYITSVVSMEMPKSWPLEAQKAQTIAARTYALYKRQENAGNNFDVAMDVSDQAYGGVEGESEASAQAVSATQGIVLMYENRLALTYFHSNSGGKTETASEIFRGMNQPYLKSVPCRYANKSPYFTWQLNIKMSEIEAAMSRNGMFSGKIGEVSVYSHTSSGRVRQLKIYGRNKTAIVDAGAFRLAVGGTRFKSTKFTIRRFGQSLSFVGNGYGHGVGLCQWGAKGMADEKRNYKEILSHYYPGTTLSGNILTSSVD